MAIDNVSGFMIEAFELYICQQINDRNNFIFWCFDNVGF